MSSYNMARSTVREYAGGSVGGILRKGGAHSNGGAASTSSAAVSAGEARQVDLLVFGYACKVFRDDDKARDIDQGKHLIPWMGDTTLKIDRYDVRGALSDLAPYEPPPGGYGNRLDYLSAEEQRAEQLCEEERYLYLYNNEEDHILQQEEDLKRLKQESGGSAYNQVDFQYGGDAAGGDGVPHGPNREEHNSSPATDEAEEAFSLPKNFEVPISIQLPETMKQHAIIEKTARFIASQGVQMEILLKAKQSNNVQFEFLSQNSLLNPYYKFIVNAIKNGTYPATPTATSPEPSDQPNASTAPASAFVTAISVAKPVITVPVIKYKPSANCAYTQLISKIKGLPLPAMSDDENANAADGTARNSPTSAGAASGGNFTPVLLQYNGNTYVTADVEDSNSNLNANINTSPQDTQQPQVELLVNSSALALAQNYSSDSEEECEAATETKVEKAPKLEPILTFPIPTESLKNIIDKTATYVIKNGRQFEETLRAKNDDRFTFLLHDNEFYAYYMYKITGDPDAASKEQKQRKAAAVAAALLSKKGLHSEKTISAPVCFSIKSKDEPTTATLQPVLPQETSDDDEEKRGNGETPTQASRSVPEHVQKAIQLVERQLMARNEQLAAAAVGGTVASAAISVAPASISARSRFDVDYTTATKAHIKSTKAEMERNALFEQQQQHRKKELKKAEEKVKDKLAQIAREKLGGLISKEKQLQLERKRKAMAFLNQIKGTPPSGPETPPIAEDDKAKPDDEENASDDSEASVHSIPITSYGPEEKTDDEEEQLVCIPQTHIAASATATLLQPTEAAPKSKPSTTVTVSDDDDVQLVSESKPVVKPPKQRKRMQTLTHKRRSRSRMRNSSATPSPPPSPFLRKRQRVKHSRHSSASSSCTYSDADDVVYAEEREASRIHNSKSRAHKSSDMSYTAVKSKKSSKSRSRKKKSKKHSRSRSRTPRSHSKRHHNKNRRRSRSYSRSYSVESAASVTSHQEHRHADRQRANKRSSQTPTLKRKEKKRKHEH